ncbi:ty3-gypsy retrotransposon protein [Tanacetum coccineum]
MFIGTVHHYCSSLLVPGTDGALQAELQVTMEMIQVAHHEGGGGDNLSLTVPRSMRLNVPKFSGLDPDSWIFAITGYFTLLNTPVDQQLRMVGFNLKVDASEWFRWMSRNMLITTWGGFLESVQNRFWPCMYEDPQGALSKLLQKGTVAQYQSEFEKMMNRVTDVYEGLLISFYISGLKLAIQRELLVSKPASLGEAFSLARVTEARLEDQGKIGSGTVHVLIDNGSTHNFVRPDVVEKICLPVQSSKPFKVYIESGETLLCESICSQVTLSMQGLIMEVDLYVLPKKGPDIVLRIQWLQNLGKVTYDYLNQTVEFSWSGRDYALKSEEQVVNFSKDEHEGQPVEQPLVIYDTLIILQKGISVQQVLVQWSRRPPEEATWKWLYDIQEAYSSYHLEDKVNSEGEKNVTPSPREPRRSKRARSKPAWQKDYAM